MCLYLLGVFYDYATSVVKNIEAISIEPVRILCVDYTANTDTLLDTPINLLLVSNARPALVGSSHSFDNLRANDLAALSLIFKVVTLGGAGTVIS